MQGGRELLPAAHREGRILTGRMTENWQKGVKFLKKALADVEGEQEQLSVAEALNILFASGDAILSFYHLRTQLGKMKGNASEIPDFVVILNE